MYEHPVSKETWEIEDLTEQRQAKAKAFAERKKAKAAQAKKGGKGRKSNNPAGDARK